MISPAFHHKTYKLKTRVQLANGDTSHSHFRMTQVFDVFCTTGLEVLEPLEARSAITLQAIYKM
jgi:hypothetical protein